jgi:diphthamide synthase subunit DPH2
MGAIAETLALFKRTNRMNDNESSDTKSSLREKADSVKKCRCKNLIAVLENPQNIKNITQTVRNINTLVRTVNILGPKVLLARLKSLSNYLNRLIERFLAILCPLRNQISSASFL